MKEKANTVDGDHSKIEIYVYVHSHHQGKEGFHVHSTKYVEDGNIENYADYTIHKKENTEICKSPLKIFPLYIYARFMPHYFSETDSWILLHTKNSAAWVLVEKILFHKIFFFILCDLLSSSEWFSFITKHDRFLLLLSFFFVRICCCWCWCAFDPYMYCMSSSLSSRSRRHRHIVVLPVLYTHFIYRS